MVAKKGELTDFIDSIAKSRASLKADKNLFSFSMPFVKLELPRNPDDNINNLLEGWGTVHVEENPKRATLPKKLYDKLHQLSKEELEIRVRLRSGVQAEHIYGGLELRDEPSVRSIMGELTNITRDNNKDHLEICTEFSKYDIDVSKVSGIELTSKTKESITFYHIYCRAEDCESQSQVSIYRYDLVPDIFYEENKDSKFFPDHLAHYLLYRTRPKWLDPTKEDLLVRVKLCNKGQLVETEGKVKAVVIKEDLDGVISPRYDFLYGQSPEGKVFVARVHEMQSLEIYHEGEYHLVYRKV